MYTFDHDLFLWLNFDGGETMDFLMKTISGTLMWLPLYAFIIYWAFRYKGWKSALVFVLCIALAIGLSDVLAGIFKHQGLLKDLWASFPPRPRPMHTPELQGLMHIPSGGHGHYGTVSAHAATVVSLAWMSGLMIKRWWYSVAITIIVLLICYSRIYLACHFPMDILLGSVLGTITGLVMYLLWVKMDLLLKRAN